MWQFAFGLAMLVALAVAAGSFAAWMAGRAFSGEGPPPGHPAQFPFFIVLILAILGVAGAVRMFGRLALPVGDLVDAARRIEAGDYSVRVPERGSRDLRNVARAFNAMTARLEATETTRRTFLADVTHELRTPLSVIRGQAEGIADGVYPADSEHLAPILAATTALERLVEDLRTLTLTEAGALRLTKEAIDLDGLILDAVNAFGPQAQAGGITLAVEAAGLPPVTADPVRLQAVLSNLLTNAIAHTPRGGEVRVQASRSDGSVEVSVADTGTGIPAELLPRVFERFAKGPESRGSGLGLAIARDLVEAHGGQIAAENRSGGGAVLRFALPL